MTTLAAAAHEIAADLPPEPYPGLRPFNPDEWAIFFGRESMIDEVIRLLAGQHLVVVHGASGCGKSSLVRAGVLPWLSLDHAASGVPWRTAIARPAGGPLRNLSAALAGAVGPPPDAAGDPATAWHDRLALGAVALADIQAALAGAKASLCLLIDQFEELFRWARENREEAQLVTELLRLVADGAVPRLFVILTMRSDYLGACAGFEGFAETVNRCQYLLPRMDDFALLRAVHEPAPLYGGSIANEVGDRLLLEARREQDPLPVLQHTLMRACRRAREHHGSDAGWTVTSADVAAVEGDRGALAAHAEEVLAALTAADASRLPAAEWVFRTITDLDAEGRLVRRPRSLAELIEVAGDRKGVLAVVEAYRAPGCSFLTSQPPGPLTDDSEIDISHEALIRRWPCLADDRRDPVTLQPQGWVWREFEDGLRWRGLAVQAAAFERNTEATLSPATTESYESWWPTHKLAWSRRYARDPDQALEEYAWVNSLRHASQKALAAERERMAEERRLRRHAQWAARAAGVLVLLCIAALVGVGWLSWSANHAKNQALVDESRLLARIASACIDEEGPVTAALLALRGLPKGFDPLDRPVVPDTVVALESALGAQSERRSYQHDSAVVTAVFSPNGERVLTASWDTTVRLWDAASGQELRTLRGHEEPVDSAVFSPNGERVLTASWDSTARLWDAASGQELRTLRGHESKVTSAIFAPDGMHVLTASADSTARLWDAASGRQLVVLRGHEGFVRTALFSPNGARVLTASVDNTARLWDAASGQELRVLRKHESVVISAVFSPDGSRVLTTSQDGTARLWDAASGQELHVLRHEDEVWSGMFSPDGARVLTASSDHTARLWDVASGQKLGVLRGHEDFIEAAVFSSNGARVLTASWDTTARLWDAASGHELRILRGHEGGVNGAVFSPDEASVLTASSDHSARLWDAASGQQLRVLRGHEGPVNSAVFSPDGSRVLTASSDHSARYWDAASGQQLRVLGGHDGPVNSAVFSPDGTRVLTASSDHTARLWDTASGQELQVLRGHQDSVNSAVFSFDGARVLTASSDKTARLWDAASGQQLRVLRGHEGPVNSAVFSPDGARVLTGSDDGSRLWSAASGQLFRELLGRAAIFSPDGARVLTTLWDQTVRLWDAASGEQLRDLDGVGRSAVFSPDGTRILATTGNETARISDAASGQELRVLRGHEKTVLFARYSADGTRIITASDDNTARLWETWPTVQALVQEALRRMPRQLTADQEVRFGLRSTAE